MLACFVPRCHCAANQTHENCLPSQVNPNPSVPIPTSKPAGTSRNEMGGASVDVDGAAEASSPLLLPRSAPRPAVSAEVTRQVGLAAPLVACSLLQYCLQVVSVMFAGHLGELSLSGASVAASFANVTGFSVLVRAVQ